MISNHQLGGGDKEQATVLGRKIQADRASGMLMYVNGVSGVLMNAVTTSGTCRTHRCLMHDENRCTTVGVLWVLMHVKGEA